MSENYRIDLQHFAGEGAAPGGEGGGGSAGESAAVAGQQADALEALGVPKDKAERYRKRNAGRKPPQQETTLHQSVSQTASPQGEAQDGERAETSAQQPASQAAPTQGEAERKTLKQLLQDDPQLNAEAQEIIKKRLEEERRASGKYRAALERLEPGLKLLQKARYGIDGDVDAETLAEKIEKDPGLFEQMADELGTSPDIARKLYERDELVKAEQRRRDDEKEQREAREFFDRLWQQGEDLKKIYPSFDLRAEMQNPAFKRMVSPSGGLTVQQAYQALHYQELRQAEAAVIAAQVKEELARSIAAGQSRPVEGKRGQAASSGTMTPAAMSREDRDALKKRIHASAYTGEKIYPGG